MNEKHDPIYVTRPALPDLEEFLVYVREAWEGGNFTSGPKGAPLVNRLEKELAACFGVPECVLFSNGTVALQLALMALNVKGDVVTSPFTYVATSSAILDAGCRPVYADVDDKTFNLDPASVEARISDTTGALMPVHVFGQPCDIPALQSLAEKTSLKVIFDAAHCFGSRYQGRSILHYGDASILSFQATKVFQTGEGGAVLTRSRDLAARLRRTRIFGLSESSELLERGMNGKMPELSAAMGLALLPHMGEVLADRKRVFCLYQELLGRIPELRFQRIDAEDTNYSYVAVVFEKETRKKQVISTLTANAIVPREYFSPSLDTVPYLGPQPACPVAQKLASHILCLPIYYKMEEESVRRICRLIVSSLENSVR